MKATVPGQSIYYYVKAIKKISFFYLFCSWDNEKKNVTATIGVKGVDNIYIKTKKKNRFHHRHPAEAK